MKSHAGGAVAIALVAWLAAPASVLLAVDTASSGNAGLQSTAPMEPLKMPRIGLQPIDDVRELAYLQDRINGGDEIANLTRPQVAESIARRLRTYPADVWKDMRNRAALVKFTLSGGDPNILRGVAGNKMFAESETSLARGALAFAEGFSEQALRDFEKVDVQQLTPSLAGQVALAKAILLAQSNHAAAMHTTRLARSLSPGTLVEEAALRLAVELALLSSDRRRLESDVSRYLRRFPSSRFAPSVLAQVAAFVAFNDYGALPREAAWLASIAVNLEASRRADFFIATAEHAVRYGRLMTVKFATSHAAASGGERSSILAYEGAALVVTRNPQKGLDLLAAADRFSPDAATAELIGAGRIVAELIMAPPVVASNAAYRSDAAAIPAQRQNAAAAIAVADKVLEETLP